MNSTTSAPGRLARAVVMQLLKRLTGGTVRLIDPFGDERFGDDTVPHASPRIDVTVHVRDTRVYSRILREGSVGLGESYADGWWDTDDLTGLLRLAHRNLARTHTAATACTVGYDPSSIPSRDDGVPTRTGTPATSGRTTTSATSSSNGSSTKR